MTHATGEPLRVAIAGAGLMGGWHAHAITRAGGRIVAVADSDLNAARALAARCHAQPFTSAAEMLSAIPASVLHICTPLETHMSLALNGLAAGLHVLVEKPLAPNAVMTERLVAAARARGRLLMPVHQFVFQPGILAARAQITRIAPLVQLAATASTAGGEGLDSRGRDQLAADILPHALSLCQEFLACGVDSLRWSCLHPAPGELAAIAQEEGVTLSLRISTAARPTRNELMLAGAHGTIHADLFHGFAILQPGAVSRWRKAAQPFTFAAQTSVAAAANLMARSLRGEPAYPGLRPLIEKFYQAIRSGAPAPIASSTILSIARARDALLPCLGLGDPQ